MKKLFLHLILVLFAFQSLAQTPKLTSRKGKEIIEYVPENPDVYRPLPENYQAELLQKMAQEPLQLATNSQQATPLKIFKFVYATNTPTEVISIFEKAASIWEKVFTTDQTITVQVYWTPLASNVLGSAGASNYYANFPGAARLNTFYPVALAEKIAHTNYNGTEPDIIARFNSDFTNWYIGTEGLPKVGREYDLLSVVIHEIGHGLGFIGQFEISSDRTTVGYQLPGIFDQFMETNAGVKLTDTTTAYKNNSAALLSAVTARSSLFLNGPAIQAAQKNRAMLYSPTNFSDGSSIYHVDNNGYPVGDPNSLMTPQISPGEVTRSVGPIVEGLFKDIGWYGSSIFAENYPDTEANDQDFVFEAKLYSDTLLKPNSLKLMLSSNASITAATAYTPTLVSGTTNTYRYVLPKSSSNRVIRYYWIAETAAGKSFTTPAEAPVIAGTNFGSFYQFTIGADTVKPKITYANPLRYVFASQTKLNLPTVYAKDNIGISSVVIQYNINGGSNITKNLSLSTTEADAYNFTFDFTSSPLKSGDVVKYKIIVTDKSKNANTVSSPSTGFYEFRVVDFLSPVNEYITSFDRYPFSDFYLKGFSITKPSFFDNAGLHSEHNYADGSEDAVPGTSGGDKFTNNDAILLKPIIVRADTAKIYFDQIVLVEPGEDGESFYNSDGSVNRYFYDYVIVQASKDQGKTWIDLSEGWDARKDAIWLTNYNSAINRSGNSTAVGVFEFFKPHTIDLKENGVIKSGDNIILRFRLHADAGANGWGWAIDNLNVQGPKGKKDLVLGVEKLIEASALEVFPNPSVGTVKVRLQSSKVMNELQLELLDMQGKQYLNEQILVNGNLFERNLEVSQLPVGTYVINVRTENQQISRKIVVIK